MVATDLTPPARTAGATLAGSPPSRLLVRSRVHAPWHLRPPDRSVAPQTGADPRSPQPPAPEPAAVTRAPRNWLWLVARTLLLLGFSSLPAAIYLAWHPVTNPAVQECGSPLGFFLRGRENVVPLPSLPGDDVTPEQARAQSQPTCRRRASEQLAGAGLAFGSFFAFSLTGAVLGLADDRRQLRRSPRFEDLLRDLPPIERVRHGLVAGVDADDLGVHLPAIEGSEVIAMVAMGVITFVGLPLAASVGSVREAVAAVRPGPLVLAVVAVAVAYGFAAFQRQPRRARDWRRLATWVIASSWLGRLRPVVGSAGVDIHRFRRDGTPAPAAVAHVQVVQTVGLALHCLLLAGGLLLVLRTDRPALDLGGAQLGLVLAVFLALANGLSHTRRRWRGLPVHPSFASLRAFDRVAPDGAARTQLLVGTTGITLARTAVLAGCVSAFGVSVPPVVLLVVVVLAVSLGAVGPLTGGTGMVEAMTMLLLIVLGGVAPAPAAAAALTYSLLTVWLPMIPGWRAARSLQVTGEL